MNLHREYVASFKREYYSVMEVLTLLSLSLIGFIPSYFAVSGLMKVSGLYNLIGEWAWVVTGFFAVILEVLGIAILKQATRVILERYGQHKASISLACGAIYVVNMMLLTTLHELLPDGLKPLSVGLLCLMPVVAYVASGIQESQDKTAFSVEEERRDQVARQREIEDRKAEQDFQIRMMRETAKLERSDSRSKKRSEIVPVGTVLTEEQERNDESGTILGHIERNGYKSLGEISKATTIPKTTVSRIIDGLTADGKLHRIDDNGKVKYELNGWH